MSIGKPPGEILFNRSIKTRLPQMETEDRLNLDEDKELRDKDQQQKSKMKQFADPRDNARSCNLTISDSVLVKQPKINQFSSYYDSNPFKIVAINGSMITVARDNSKTITCNVSHSKKLSSSGPPYNQTGEESEDGETDEPPAR